MVPLDNGGYAGRGGNSSSSSSFSSVDLSTSIICWSKKQKIRDTKNMISYLKKKHKLIPKLKGTEYRNWNATKCNIPVVTKCGLFCLCLVRAQKYQEGSYAYYQESSGCVILVAFPFSQFLRCSWHAR